MLMCTLYVTHSVMTRNILLSHHCTLRLHRDQSNSVLLRLKPCRVCYAVQISLYCSFLNKSLSIYGRSIACGNKVEPWPGPESWQIKIIIKKRKIKWQFRFYCEFLIYRFPPSNFSVACNTSSYSCFWLSFSFIRFLGPNRISCFYSILSVMFIFMIIMY